MKMKLLFTTFIIGCLNFANLNAVAVGKTSIERDAKAALDGSVIPNPGDKMEWVDGTLTRKADGSLYYESSKVSYSNTIKSVDDVYLIANHNKNIASHLVNQYGVNPGADASTYKNFNDNFWDLTARPHSPNLKWPISPAGFPGDYTLNYDEDGIAQTVTTPDGLTLTIAEFKRTNAYAAMSGSNDVGPLSEVEREFSLASLIWGVKEKGVKECKGTDKDVPPYMKKWADAIKVYHQDEIDINDLLVKRMAMLDEASKKLQENYSAEYQIEIFKVQLEAMNMSIDALEGTSTFSLDKSTGGAKIAAPKSRITAREKMLEQALSTLLDSEKDKLKFFEAYKIMQEKIGVSFEIAKKGCARISIVEECVTDDSGAQTCTNTEKNDPVEGSCEMVEKFLPVLENGPFYDYAKIYFLETVPSFEINNRMLKVEQIMEAMYNQFPDSGLAEFDWRTPLADGYKILKGRRVEQGMICSNPNPEKSDEEYKKIPLEVADYSNLVLGSDKGMSLFDKNKLMVNSDFKLNFSFDGLKYDDVKLTKETSANERFTAIIEDGKNIADYQKFYISVFAIKDLPEDKVFESFLKNWFQTDLVVGQSGQRGVYLNYAIKVLEDAIAMDKVKLENLKEDKAVLEKVIEKVEEQLNEQKLAAEQEKSKGSSNVSSTRGGTSGGVGSISNSGNQLSNAGQQTQDFGISTKKLAQSNGLSSSGFLRSGINSNSGNNLKNLRGRTTTSGDISGGGANKNARAEALEKDIQKTRKSIAAVKSKILKKNNGLKKLNDSMLANNKGSFKNALALSSSKLSNAYTGNEDNQRIYKAGLKSNSKEAVSKAVTGTGKSYSSTKYKFSSGSSSSSGSSYSRDAQSNSQDDSAVAESEELRRFGGRVEFDKNSYNKNELFEYISKMYQDVGIRRLGFED